MDESLLAGLDEYEVWTFFATRSAETHIIAPPEMLQRILAVTASPLFTCASDIVNPDKDSKEIFAWDLDPSELNRVRHAYPNSRAFGILRDLWCAVVTASDVADLARPVSLPVVNYAIICPPRSGSTFLCDLLRTAGFGNPVEHIRDLFIGLCRRGYDLAEIMSWMSRRGTHGGFFGTKLLSHYLQAMRHTGNDPEVVHRFLQRENFRIIRLLRDPAEEAVSIHFAHHTGQWHLYGPGGPGSRHDAVPYDSAALIERYRETSHANQFVVDFASRFDCVLAIDYCELDRDPHSIIAEVADFLGAPPAVAARIDLPQYAQKISRTQNRMQEYLHRLRQDLARRPTDPE